MPVSASHLFPAPCPVVRGPSLWKSLSTLASPQPPVTSPVSQCKDCLCALGGFVVIESEFRVTLGSVFAQAALLSSWLQVSEGHWFPSTHSVFVPGNLWFLAFFEAEFKSFLK